MTDKPLFTPGPLTTSAEVKQAMLRDLGSRDVEFIETVRRVREGLLELAGVSRELGWEAVLMQGSGTFGIEAVISSAVPRGGRLLVAVNGAYGARIASIARAHGIETAEVACPENRVPDVDIVAGAIDEHRPAMLAVVHCETTTGILNPVHALTRVARERGVATFVDSMSAFGAVPVDLRGGSIDFLVSSANKCIEGVPGFSFIICRREALLACGDPRTVSLDLRAQWKGLEANGQFRFTPPTHAILAFDRALRELADEGGVEGRAARYRENHACLVREMRELGFKTYLPPELQSAIITSYRYPDSPRFFFEDFYARLNAKGFVIYPGKVSDAACFRIGTIGRIFPDDVRGLLAAIRETLSEMGLEMGLGMGLET